MEIEKGSCQFAWREFTMLNRDIILGEGQDILSILISLAEDMSQKN